MRRMYQAGEDRFYYITLYNEDYRCRRCRRGGRRNSSRIYKYRSSAQGQAMVQLFGSGAILNEALRAQDILAKSTVCIPTYGA